MTEQHRRGWARLRSASRPRVGIAAVLVVSIIGVVVVVRGTLGDHGDTGGSGRGTADAAPTTRSATATPTAKAPPETGSVWRPPVGVAWQWQLSGAIDTTIDAPVYDIDADTPAATVAALHAKGRHVICYVDVGSWEPDRPDAAQFPASVKGAKMSGWNEYWLDIRALDVLRPLISARLDTCQAKGFDAVEADNVDGYTDTTGFPLTASDQLTFNRMIAQLAHQRGLSIALKNDVDQTAALEPAFDFAINEQCFEYDECASLDPFVRAGKAVLQVEYSLPLNAFCGHAAGFSSMRKHLELDARRQPCP